jgi:hypothetical protein
MEKIQSLLQCRERSAVEIMENILIILEHLPFTSNECHVLQEICLKFMQEHQMTKQDQVYQLFLKRMSFTYLPGVSTLHIPRKTQTSPLCTSTSPLTTNDTSTTTEIIDLGVEEPRLSTSIDSFSDHESLLVAVNYTPSKYRYICTMHRKKTTLQTSYRLEINGCHSISGDTTTSSSLVSRSDSLPLTPPLDPLFSLQLSLKGLILSAKKQNRTLGLSSSYQIWGPAGGKEWKEKLSIGKLVRNNGIYSGYLTDYCQETLAASCPSQYLPYIPGNKRGISVKVLSGGLDKLLHVIAAIQIEPTTSTPPPTEITSSTVTGASNVMNSPTPLSSSPPPSTISDLEPETTTPPPPASQSASSSTDIENDPELILHSLVETICSSKSSSSQLLSPLPSNTLLLQSRRPRKLKSSDTQQLLLSSSTPSYYTIHYGDHGRVRNPSRKNIVMERMKYNSVERTVHNNIFLNNEDSHCGGNLLEPEWMSNESNSMSSSSSSSSPTHHGNGNVYSPTVDMPVLQVCLLLPCWSL